jgi:hypothetical protein
VTKLDSERALRRAVSDLLKCPIEDIEFVWNALDARERDRLRPIMAAASEANGKTSDWMMPTIPVDGIAHHIETLPDRLAARLYGCLDSATQRAVATLLSEARLRVIGEHRDMASVTEHTRDAWLKACLATKANIPHVLATASRRRTFADSIGRALDMLHQSFRRLA